MAKCRSSNIKNSQKDKIEVVQSIYHQLLFIYVEDAWPIWLLRVLRPLFCFHPVLRQKLYIPAVFKQSCRRYFCIK